MRVTILIALLLMITVGAAWAEFEELSIDNVGLDRTVSGTINILKTTKLQAAGVKLLEQPSIEVMLDVEYKGSLLTLIPSDFDIKKMETVEKGKERQTRIELRSHYDGLPFILYVDYWRDPRNQYQQKSITLTPCKAAAGAILKRITIDSMQFTDNIQPIAASATGFVNENKSSFAMIDGKSEKGICFDFPSGKIELGRRRTLSAYEEMNASVADGYTTGRITLCQVSGKPEAVFRSYRQMLLETRFPTLARDLKLGALRKRFQSYFAVCQYLPEDGSVSAEGHIVDNKGFMLLFNMSSESSKVTLPLAYLGLGLSGDIKLTDWTSLDSPTDMGASKIEDKIEIELPSKGYRLIGVNIDG